MEKAVNWLRERKQEVIIIWKELLPHIALGLIDVAVTWWLLYVATSVAVILAIIRTYWLEGNVEFDKFFPPNFWWGVKWVTIFLIVYQVSATIAKRLNFLRIHADKFTWNDIKIDIIPFPTDYIVNYGIGIHNKKPFKMEKTIVRIAEVEVGRNDRTIRHLYPAPLAWLDERKFYWGEIDIDPSGGEEKVALFYSEGGKDKRYLHVPGPDGQPTDKKSMSHMERAHGVMFADFFIDCMIEGHKMKKKIKLRAEILDNNDVKVNIIEEKPIHQ